MTSIEYLLYSYDNYKMVLTKSMPSKLSTGKPCPRTWPCGTWPVCLGGSEDVMSYIGSPQTSYIEVLTPGSLCVTSLEQTAFAEVTKWGQWGELRSFWPHFIPSTRRKYGHRHVEGRRSKDTGRTGPSISQWVRPVPTALRRLQPCWLLHLNFQPPDLWENAFVAWGPSLRGLVMAARANSYAITHW